MSQCCNDGAGLKVPTLQDAMTVHSRPFLRVKISPHVSRIQNPPLGLRRRGNRGYFHFFNKFFQVGTILAKPKKLLYLPCFREKKRLINEIK